MDKEAIDSMARLVTLALTVMMLLLFWLSGQLQARVTMLERDSGQKCAAGGQE